MRILLTRPAADAARTRATLEALGHRVLVSPVIVVEPTGAPWPSGVVDAVLATSGQAFAFGVHEGPSPEARRLMPLWVVGGRTEAVARQHGFAGASVAAQNAVALAMEMGKRRGLGRIVYLAGKDRKPDIETALAVTDQAVETIEVYAARPADGLEPAARSALECGAVDAVLHFSRRSACLFAALARDLPPGPLVHHCLSADVAEPLRERGWATALAVDPSEAALIATLTRST